MMDDRPRTPPPDGPDSPEPIESTIPIPSRARAPETIGPFKILERLGSGGMGDVYLAEQETPIRRKVAVKVIKVGMDTEEVIARFEAERQALAMMNHPGVAKIHDAGSTEAGRPYFVMEYVPGEPITTYCDRHNLGIRERLELFIQVCQAIHHAHQKGIIHRDIKPTNILVAIQDGQPVPKVIDFGVAKATQQRLTEKTLFTEQGRMIGTPAYMSPEQAEMTGLNIDTTTDVYSLGVLLYELLVGVVPFGDQELRRAGIAEINRILREVDPPRPSTKISTLGDDTVKLATHRRLEPRRWRKLLHGELDWITMQTLEKDRTRRYQSTVELAQDIRRYLDHEPVLASSPGSWYRLRKLGRRYRGPLMGVGFVALALLLGLVVSLRMYVDAERARQDAVRQSYIANFRAADAHLAGHRAADARTSLDACPPGLRRWEWNHLDLILAGQIDEFAPAGARGIAVHGSSARAAVLDTSGAIRLFDIDSRQHILDLVGSFPDRHHLEFSPDGRLLLVSDKVDVTNDYLVSMLAFDTVTGKLLHRLETGRDGLGPLAISADGKRLGLAFLTGLTLEDGSSIADGEAQVWNLETGELAWSNRDTSSTVLLGFSPDGDRLAVCSANGVVTLLDGAGGAPLGTVCRDCYYCAEFAPDGNHLAYADFEGAVHLVETSTEKKVWTFQNRGADVADIAFSPDRLYLVISREDGTINTWNLMTGKLENTFFSPSSYPRARFDATGARLFSISDKGSRYEKEDRTVLVWDLSARARQTLQGVGGSCLAFSPDGRRLVGGSEESYLDDRGMSYNCAVRIWDVASGSLAAVLRGHEGWVHTVAFSPDGKRIVSGSQDGTVMLWNGDSGELLQTARRFSPADSLLIPVKVAFSPCGRWLAVGYDDSVLIRDPGGAGIRWTGPSPGGDLEDLAFSPDGGLIGACGGRTLRIWGSETGEVSLDHSPGAARLSALAFDPSGRQVLIGGAGGFLLTLDSRIGDPVRSFPSEGPAITAVAWFPDGSRIATRSWQGCRLWDAVSGAFLMDLFEGNELARGGLAISPDGEDVALQADHRIKLLKTRNSVDDAPARRTAFLDRGPVEALVDSLFGLGLTLHQAEQRIRLDTSLDAPRFAAALRWAGLVGGDPEALNRRAWSVVRTDGQPPAAVAEALDLAVTAHELNPLHPTFLKTLGAARFRLGLYEDALTALVRSDSSSSFLLSGGGHPTTVALLAMTLHRLGREVEAEAEFHRLHDLMQGAHYRQDPDCVALYREAGGE